MCFVGKTGVEPDIIMLSEISKTHKDKYCIFSLIVDLGTMIVQNDEGDGRESRQET